MALRYELYEDRNSVVHRLDPRVKIILLFEVFATSVLFVRTTILLPLFIGVCLVLWLSHVSWAKIRVFLGGLLSLALMSIILWPLFYHKGTVFWSWGPVIVTEGGLVFGVAMASRILAMVLASFVLMLTTSYRDLILGFRGLGLPFRAAFTVAMALRFLPTVIGMGRTITEAQRARGLDLDKGSLFSKARKAAPILGPLMLNAIRLAQQMAIAVEIRGLDSKQKRSDFYVLKMNSYDVVILSLSLLALAALVSYRFII